MKQTQTKLKCFCICLISNNKLNTATNKSRIYTMNLSHFPNEIISLIKDFVFSKINKIPSDDSRYTMLHLLYDDTKENRQYYGRIILSGGTMTTQFGVICCWIPNRNNPYNPYNPLFDHEFAQTPNPNINWETSFISPNPNIDWDTPFNTQFRFSSFMEDKPWDVLIGKDPISRPLTTSDVANGSQRRGREKERKKEKEQKVMYTEMHRMNRKQRQRGNMNCKRA